MPIIFSYLLIYFEWEGRVGRVFQVQVHCAVTACSITRDSVARDSSVPHIEHIQGFLAHASETCL